MGRAQRHEEATRPLRLLADHPVLQGDALVQSARLEAAGAEAGQDRIAALQPGAPVGGRRDGQLQPLSARHLLGQRPNDAEMLRVQIDQDDLGAPEALAPPDKGGHGARGTGAAAADVRELDSCHGVTFRGASAITPAGGCGGCDRRPAHDRPAGAGDRVGCLRRSRRLALGRCTPRSRG